MNTNMKYLGILLGALLTLVPYAAEATLACSNPNCWQVGGETGTLTASEIETNADVPNGVNANAVGNTTYYWMGGYTTSSGCTNNVLSQPGFIATQQSNPWQGYFSIACGNTVEDSIFSTLTWSHPGSVGIFDEVFPSGNTFHGQNYQQMIDNNNSMRVDSVFFKTYTYGNSFSSLAGALESYDFTGRDLSAMDTTPIHFTSFDYAATYGGSFTAASLSAYSDASSGFSAPSCITSTAGSGTTTISLSC